MKKIYLFIRLVLILNILLYNVFNINFYSKNKTKIIIDHAGNKVRIPINPKRIASLNDDSISLMLLELSCPIIGTATHINSKTGKFYIRSVESLFGIKFENTNYYNYGDKGQDIEQIKLSKPDLIIGVIKYHSKVYSKLSSIAPSLLLRMDIFDKHNSYKDLAIWLNKKNIFKQKEIIYQKRIQKIKNILNLKGKTFSYLQVSKNKYELSVYKYARGIGKVLIDLGMKVSNFIKKQISSDNYKIKLSTEIIDKLDADYIFTTFSKKKGETINSPAKKLYKINLNWRNFLSAAKNGRFISLEANKARRTSFKSYHFILNELLKYVK